MIDVLFSFFYSFLVSPFIIPFMGLSFVALTFFSVNLLFRGCDK